MANPPWFGDSVLPLPSLSDAQIKSDQPLDEALTKEGLRDRDEWNWSQGDNGGSGINANIDAFIATTDTSQAVFGAVGHSHDGTDGQGQNIDTAGIANGAASLEPMFTNNCVSSGKIAGNTLTGAKFEDLAVTTAKMSGTMGTHKTGSQPYDTTAPPDTGAGDVTFLGDRATYSGSGVIVNQKATSSGVIDYFPVRPGVLGFFYQPGIHAATDLVVGWEWDFWVVG